MDLTTGQARTDRRALRKSIAFVGSGGRSMGHGDEPPNGVLADTVSAREICTTEHRDSTAVEGILQTVSQSPALLARRKPPSRTKG